MEKIRIAILASTLETGGSEQVTGYLLERLPEDRFEPFLCLLQRPGAIGQRLLDAGIPGRSCLRRCRFDPLAVLRLFSIFRRLRPHLLFMLDHHDVLFYARLAALLAGVPKMVVACHSTGRVDRQRNFDALDRAFMRFTDIVVALSWSHARHLETIEGIDQRKIAVIENGVDVEFYGSADPLQQESLRSELGLSEDDKVAIMIAALRPEKAHEILLEAARLLARKGRKYRFLIVGDGPRRSELEKAVVRSGLERSVCFLGERKDVPDLLRLAGVLVLPSRPVVETMPLVVLEAMAAGVPVVASRVGSIPDVIENRVDGLLVPPGDPCALAEAIEFVLEQREKASSLAEAALRKVRRRYTATRMVKEYVDLFERLAGVSS